MPLATGSMIRHPSNWIPTGRRRHIVRRMDVRIGRVSWLGVPSDAIEPRDLVILQVEKSRTKFIRPTIGPGRDEVDTAWFDASFDDIVPTFEI